MAAPSCWQAQQGTGIAPHTLLLIMSENRDSFWLEFNSCMYKLDQDVWRSRRVQQFCQHSLLLKYDFGWVLRIFVSRLVEWILLSQANAWSLYEAALCSAFCITQQDSVFVIFVCWCVCVNAWAGVWVGGKICIAAEEQWISFEIIQFPWSHVQKPEIRVKYFYNA